MKSGENPDRDFIEQITQRQSDKKQIRNYIDECEQPKRYNRSFASYVKVVEQAHTHTYANKDTYSQKIAISPAIRHIEHDDVTFSTHTWPRI